MSRTRAWARGLVALFLLLVVLVSVGYGVARTTFETSERSIAIGAHDALLRPNYSGDVVLNLGPLLPLVKLPTERQPLGIGATIQVGHADVTSIEELIARDAVIASQPSGEIAAVRAAIEQMWWDSAWRGAGVSAVLGVVLVGSWFAVGPARRRELREGWRSPTWQRWTAVGACGALIAGGTYVAVTTNPSSIDDDVSWVRVVDAYPNLPADPLLSELELSEGSVLSSAEALVESLISTYQSSNAFFGTLAETAKDVDVRTPQKDQTTALVVTDRHDNVAMDPVARVIAERAEAELLLDLGDDTSSGASWETFSINSLAKEFAGFDVVAVLGNHDNGTVIADSMKEHGFTLLEGEPVEVAGIRFLGAPDPRSSGLTKGYSGDGSDNSAAIGALDEELTEVACEDGDVSVVLVHSSAAAKELAASGCVDLILSGHLHRQVGPAVVEGGEGSTVTLTTGTTGGAVYAFALGTGLRREAQVTIVTFEDGRPVGLQLIDINPGGIITPQPYVTMAELIDPEGMYADVVPAVPPEPTPEPETSEP